MTTETIEDLVVYRSSHPGVIAAHDAYLLAYDKWCDDWRKQIVAWGFDVEKHKPYVTNGVWGPSSLMGISWEYTRNDPPPGWRRYDRSSNRHILIPYAAKPKANPQIQEEFRALIKIPDIRRDLVAFGMPQNQFVSLRVTTYGLVRETLIDQSIIWVRWREVPDPLASDQWWEKVSLSQYYAMVEQGRDPFARKVDSEDDED